MVTNMKELTMTNTYRNIHTRDEDVGKYAVARYLISIVDFLHSWDAEYGASFTGVGGAITFDDKEEATRASIRVAEAVPFAMVDPGAETSPVSFRYDVVLLA